MDWLVITETTDKSRITAIVSECLETYFTQLDELAENPRMIEVMPRYLLSITDHHWLESYRSDGKIKRRNWTPGL